MNPTLKNIPIVMPMETNFPHPWFWKDQILQTTIKRFSDHPDFLLALPDTFAHRTFGRRIYRAIESIKHRIYVGAEDLWTRLLQITDLTSKKHLMVIPAYACGIPRASIDLASKVIDDSEIDLLYSDQIIGLLPLIISKKFLLKILAKEKHTPATLKPLRVLRRSLALPRKAEALLLDGRHSKRTGANYAAHDLTDIYKLQEAGDRAHNIRFFRQQTFHGPIRYLPQLPQDRALAHYLLQHSNDLESMLQNIDQLPLPGESDLLLYFKHFCDSFAITYERHILEGTPEIPEEIRALTSNPKSVGECYLRAINMTKFLKRYAGLRSTSRVLEIGCGWGALGLGLLNLIEDPGSYLGLDIQQQAIAWGLENIAPLNARFSFKHLDVANSRYNPNGSISHDRVDLPLDSDSVDLVFLSSVFTHMRREGIEHYLKEIRRLLRPGGIVAFSYFNSSFFGNNEDYGVRYPNDPDRMTVFNTAEMRRLIQAAGLSEARPQVNYDARFSPKKTFFQTFMFATK